MEDRLALAMLRAACAVAEGALPEREAHPRVFAGLLRLLAQLAAGPQALAALVRWEAVLLADLGYGLDLASCAVTGATEGLRLGLPAHRPRGRRRGGGRMARAAAAPAAVPADRCGGATRRDWRDGLRLTGHFLARDAFGHAPSPVAGGAGRALRHGFLARGDRPGCLTT